MSISRVVVAFVALLPGTVLADRTLLTDGSIQAMVPDSNVWCGERAGIVLRGSAATDFDDAQRLQRLLGGLRAALSFECPEAQAVTLVGTVGDAITYKATASAANGWRLARDSLPGTVAATPAPAPTPLPAPPATAPVQAAPPVASKPAMATPPPKQPAFELPTTTSKPKPAPTKRPAANNEPIAAPPPPTEVPAEGEGNAMLWSIGIGTVSVLGAALWFWLRRRKPPTHAERPAPPKREKKPSEPPKTVARRPAQASVPPPPTVVTKPEEDTRSKLGAARDQLLAQQRHKYEASITQALDDVTQTQLALQERASIPPAIRGSLTGLSPALVKSVRQRVRKQATNTGRTLASTLLLLPLARRFWGLPIGIRAIAIIALLYFMSDIYEFAIDGGYLVLVIGYAVLAAVSFWRDRSARFSGALKTIDSAAANFAHITLGYVYAEQSAAAGARTIVVSTQKDAKLPSERTLVAADVEQGARPGSYLLRFGDYAFYELNSGGEPRLVHHKSDNAFMTDHREHLTLAIAEHKVALSEAMAQITEYGDLVWTEHRQRAEVPRMEKLLEQITRLEDIWANVYTEAKVFDFLLRRIDLFNLRDRATPPGMLLYGYPGNGKEFIAEKIAESVFGKFVRVSAAELNSVDAVKALWEEHRGGSPVVLFFDHAEQVFANPDSGQGGASRETVLAFLEAWSLEDPGRSRVWVVLSTQTDKALHPRFTALLGSSKIEINAPDTSGRQMILEQALAENRLPRTVPRWLIEATGGSSVRDLRDMVKDAKLHSLPNPPTDEHWRESIKNIRGTDGALIDPSKTWDRIVLPEDTKEQLKRAARILREADRYQERGVKVPNILLYGPPGTGKTDIARTFANESGVKFMTATTADLKAQYTGQSAHLVRGVFAKARASAPCVLFIDEIEAVAGKRGGAKSDSFSGEVVTQMLQEMEGAAKSDRQVFVLAATNLPEEVDSAILSRFTSKIEIPLPDENARREILKRLLASKTLEEGLDIDEVAALLAKRLNRKSGRDLVMLVNRAMERAVMLSDSPDDVTLSRAALLAEASPQGKEVSDAELDKIWSQIVLDPLVQESIVSKIKMFNAADKAAPRGLLLYGPPGTGKTEIGRRIADSASCYFMSLSGPDLKAGYSGQSGQKVRALWDQARARGRCVIFVDECEGVFARRGSTSADSLTDELVQAFLAEWDGVASEGMIWVVGATNRRELLDDAIISRFGAAVEIGLPAAPERLKILGLEVAKLERDFAVPAFVGQASQGFSGRNLAMLAKDVVTRAAQSGGVPTDEMWREAIAQLRGGASGKDESKTWDRLVLPETIKAQLQRAVKVVQDAERYKERGVNVPNILLYGPPGTGKTDIARTFANEGGVAFLSATTADLKAGYTGQSGQKVKELFDRARGQAPCILFIDEIETVARKRGSAQADAFTNEIVTQMLAEMEGAAKSPRHVFVLAATNLPEEVDPAILSRFSNRIEVPLPDEEGRREMLIRLFNERPLEAGFDVAEMAASLAKRLNRKSGRDLVMLVNRAMERAVAEADTPDDVHLTRATLMAELAPDNKTISDQQLATVWSQIVLDGAVKESITSKIKLFNAGDKAAPKGLLLYGPPGTGKTEIARRIADSANCYFMALSGPDLKAGYVGQSGQKARAVWEQARSRGRCVMFVDECEGVFARRGSSNSDSLTDELVQAFLAEWDGVGSEGQIWVVGATNRRDLIDEAIVSRFGASVEIGLPGAPERTEILRLELRKLERTADVPDFVAAATQGFSGRNLAMLAKDVATLASERGGELTESVWREATAKLAKSGSEAVDDSARWESLILADDTLDKLRTICDSLKHIEVLKAQGLEVPKGALVFGPPGTGKTQIARTLANESGLAFLAATTADVKAGYVGQSGQKVRELFERARGKAPCILFLDEIESLAPERGGAGSDQFTNEIVTQLLQELDGVKKTDRHVFVLAATNLPDRVDPAIRSRFEEEIEIPNPDQRQREQLFDMFLRKQKVVQFDVGSVAAELAQRAGNVGGRDIRNIVQRATQNAVRRAIRAKTPDRVVLSREDLLDVVGSAN